MCWSGNETTQSEENIFQHVTENKCMCISVYYTNWRDLHISMEQIYIFGGLEFPEGWVYQWYHCHKRHVTWSTCHNLQSCDHSHSPCCYTCPHYRLIWPGFCHTQPRGLVLQYWEIYSNKVSSEQGTVTWYEQTNRRQLASIIIFFCGLKSEFLRVLKRSRPAVRTVSDVSV